MSGSTAVLTTMATEAFGPEIVLDSPTAGLGVARSDSDESGTATPTSQLGPGVYRVVAGNGASGPGAYTTRVAAVDWLSMTRAGVTPARETNWGGAPGLWARPCAETPSELDFSTPSFPRRLESSLLRSPMDPSLRGDDFNLEFPYKP